MDASYQKPSQNLPLVRSRKGNSRDSRGFVRGSKKFWALCALCLFASAAQAATFKTANFVVTAATDDIARRVANCAEYWRHDLAVQWLGQALPNWYHPCPISVQAGQMGAGGQTTFTFENGEVYGWKMQVQGTLERILDSVVPHEVNHTIFASYFRRPLPRWADEGAATLFEHESEQARQMQLLNRVITTNRRIPLNDLLTIREYPQDMQDVLTLYAEGYSLAGFLVGSKGEQGRRIYLKFLEDAHQIGWEKAIATHYGYNSVALLEQQWTSWIMAGSPPFNRAELLAQADQPANTAADAPLAMTAVAVAVNNTAGSTADETIIRSQSPSQEETSAPLTGIDRNPAPLPGISRALRASRPQETATVLRSAQETEMRTVSQGEEFRPRALRQPEYGSASAPALSPTAEGINTNPRPEHYAFPEARR